MKKVLIIAEYFYPYNSTGAPKITFELAEDLQSLGMQVEVITSKLNYNAPLIREIKSVEYYNGIKINRVWSTLGNKNKPIKRLSNYITFLFSLFIKVINKKDYDCMIVFSNPPITTIIGHLVNKIRKKKYIYVVHDFYPDIAINLEVIGKQSLTARIMQFFNRKVFSTAKRVIAIGRDMKELLEEKGVPEEKIKVITNWADSKIIYPIKKVNEFSTKYSLDKSFNIIYTGNIGRFHDIETLIETAKKLENNTDIKFIIIGEGYKKNLVLEMKKELKLENILVLGYQDDEIYNSVLSTADLLVSSLEEGVEGLAVPSKTYSYFAANKPIIGIMNKRSEIGQVIEENDIGICISKGESDKLKNFILNIKSNLEKYNEMTLRVKKLFDENYERKVVTKKFYDLINKEF